jgi:anti-sigma-K factor RskA
MNTSSTNAAAHSALTALIPWYVNGTLGEEDRRRLESHLAECVQCRQDLDLERQVHGNIAQQAAVEYLPGPSLKKLLSRIEGIEAAPAGASLPRARRSGSRPRSWSWSWQGLTAASVAVTAIAVSVLAVDHFMQHRNSLAPDYRTVTINTPRPHDEVIRAVFAADITLVDLQALLDEAQLRIVAGPTEAGVYSLAATGKRPVSVSLALLRGHSSVRFAESTQHVAGSDRSP